MLPIATHTAAGTAVNHLNLSPQTTPWGRGVFAKHPQQLKQLQDGLLSTAIFRQELAAPEHTACQNSPSCAVRFKGTEHTGRFKHIPLPLWSPQQARRPHKVNSASPQSLTHKLHSCYKAKTALQKRLQSNVQAQPGCLRQKPHADTTTATVAAYEAHKSVS